MKTVNAKMDAEGYVIEHEGMLRTGPFKSPEAAVAWYAEELDLKLLLEQEVKS